MSWTIVRILFKQHFEHSWRKEKKISPKNKLTSIMKVQYSRQHIKVSVLNTCFSDVQREGAGLEF